MSALVDLQRQIDQLRAMLDYSTSLEVPSSGTWTPTLDLTTNVAAATASAGYYIRVGNVFMAGVRVEIDVTATGATVLGLSLPITSNIGNVANIIGTGADATGMAGEVRGNVAGDRAEFAYNSTVTANNAFYLHFIGTII